MSDLFGKTMVGGTNYNITGGKTLISGVAHPITKGKTMVGGTAYDINKKYTLKDLLLGSISFRGARNNSSSMYQLTYSSFSASNAGETWYCFATHGQRLQITKVVISSSGITLTRIQNWAKGASLMSALSADGFTITGAYSYGGMFIFLKFNSFSTSVVDETLANCQGEVIQGIDQSSTIENVLTINKSAISSTGLLFCAFAANSSMYFCFNDASSPLTSVRTYMGSGGFVTDKTIVIDYNTTQYALSYDGTSGFTYRAYGYTVARIY